MSAFAAWIALLVAALPFVVLAFELVFGLSRSSPRAVAEGAANNCSTTIAVLMPAHNEAGGIAAIIYSLERELNSGTRLIVVADNCSDDTAERARAAGAEVIERHNPQLRGKGHALAFGRDSLAKSPPDCVIVLDADCTVEPGALAQLSNAALAANAPAQSCYLLESSGGGAMVQLSNFAFLIKNLVRQRGATRLGSAAVLGGTGMAFPWPLFAEAPLATSNLVEDLALGIHFADAGYPPIFVGDVRTLSASASAGDTLTQRTRWEHGFLDTARHHALPLIARGMRKRDAALFGMGLHLLVPPLALLFAMGLVGLVALAGLTLAGGTIKPFIILTSLMAVCAGLIILAWWREGRATVSAATLLRIPLYLAWKLPVYVRLLYRRQVEWVRTGRGEDGPA